jgi:hypothetical protein
MRKCQRRFAPLTIGLWPGFVAGDLVDVAIETALGDRLGSPIHKGPTGVLAGEHRPIDGVGREGLVYAPADGIWHTRRVIGDVIRHLLELTRDGVPCARGTKMVEIIHEDRARRSSAVWAKGRVASRKACWRPYNASSMRRYRAVRLADLSPM